MHTFYISTIKTRLLLTIFVGLAILAVTAVVATQLLSSKIQAYETLLSEDSVSAVALGSLNRDFKTQVQEWKNVLLRGHEQKDRDKYWARFLEDQQDIQNQALKLQQQKLSPEVSSLLNEFSVSHAAILPKYKQAYDLFMAKPFDHKLADAFVRGIDREPSKLLSQSVDLAEQQIKQNAQSLAQSSRQTQIWTLATVVIALILAVAFISHTIRTKITSPLTKLISQLSYVSKGQFGQSIKLSAQDELGRMSEAIEKVRVKLLDVSQELGENQHELDHVSQHISQNAQAFTSKADAQYQQAVEISNATQEMASAASQISNNIEQATKIAEGASNSARESRQVMQATLNSINVSSQQISRTSEVIAQLDEDAKNVGSVVEVINAIAEQTNLLALNAAIEAARAGEQGRGFAVVADEVRTLASRTQQSTEEIKSIIAKLQERALGAVNAIKEGENSVTQTHTAVNKAAEVLSHVDTAVEEIRRRNEEIATSISHQSGLNEMIQSKVEVVSYSAEQNKQQSNDLTQQNTRLEGVRLKLETQLKRINS